MKKVWILLIILVFSSGYFCNVSTKTCEALPTCGGSCLADQTSYCCCEKASTLYWRLNHCNEGENLVSPQDCDSYTRCYSLCVGKGYEGGYIRGCMLLWGDKKDCH